MVNYGILFLGPCLPPNSDWFCRCMRTMRFCHIQTMRLRRIWAMRLRRIRAMRLRRMRTMRLHRMRTISSRLMRIMRCRCVRKMQYRCVRKMRCRLVRKMHCRHLRALSCFAYRRASLYLVDEGLSVPCRGLVGVARRQCRVLSCMGGVSAPLRWWREPQSNVAANSGPCLHRIGCNAGFCAQAVVHRFQWIGCLIPNV